MTTIGDVSPRCPDQVWRGGEYTGSYETCGAKVIRRGLCGRHANKADREDAEVARATANADFAKALTRTLGVRVQAREDGWFVINRADAEAYVQAHTEGGG